MKNKIFILVVSILLILGLAVLYATKIKKSNVKINQDITYFSKELIFQNLPPLFKDYSYEILPNEDSFARVKFYVGYNFKILYNKLINFYQQKQGFLHNDKNYLNEKLQIGQIIFTLPNGYHLFITLQPTNPTASEVIIKVK